ncbi:hypothetical protein Tco_0937190 [Tanacetum coccineum]|uniref:DUF4218 domain-containing protein n=1 Tax=Tanacetum coccineum TaxID=301880 RepID=A0ABQ5DDH8_9ASTR
MKATVLWTINDFPTRSSLSGWSGQGYFACPTCNEDTPSMAVKNKIIYVGYRRFLRTQHRLRSKFKEFYGFPEPKPKSRKFTEMDIQLQISKVFKRVPVKHPEIAKKKPKPNRKIELNWSMRSIFWDLEYWPFLLLKNNYDVMHIEKNALEALLNTLLQKDKSKDTLKARQNLETLRVRKELWLVKKPNGKFKKPHPKYMKKLKNYVRNKAKPEGSFAEGYVAEEALTFCSRYLKDVEMRFHRPGRNDDGLPEQLDSSSLEVDANILVYRERSYIDQGIHHIFTDMEFYQNNQYILATQATQVFYLEDLARRPLHWKVVEHVYHRDVAESDQDVIHGSSSSHVTVSVGMTCLEHTDLSINAQSIEVVAPPVNDDNVNANEDNADFINNEDDVVAHVLDDDDVEVSDDDEVNPSTNVEEMACVAPRSHGADASGSPPRRPTRPVPSLCQSSMLRIETGNRSLRKAFRENNEQPLKIGFDYEDLGTFHPLGNFSGMLNSLMGETVRPLPLACEWDEIPEAFKAHIYPTLESYFNLAEWYNNQDKVVVDQNVYTVGERVRLGLELKLRLLWRKNKNRIKADHYAKHTSPDEAKNHPPPPKLDMKAMKDNIKAGLIPFKTNQEILDEIVLSDNCQNMSGMGRKLSGGGSTSRRRTNLEEEQARAYLASLKADAADQQANVAQQNCKAINAALGEEEEEADKHTDGDDEYSDETSRRLYENLKTATGVCSWVAFKDVTKTLKDTKYGISMLEEKDATGKEDGTIVG